MNIDEILKQMKELSGGDPEGGHSKADFLLCELARELARLSSSPLEREVELIIDAYDNLEKWYA